MNEHEPMTRLVRTLRSGQITIPVEFRRRLGITEASLLQLTLAEGEMRLKPVHTAERGPGSPWLKDLYALFAPARREAAHYNEEEVNAAIDEAVKAVRAGYDAGRS